MYITISTKKEIKKNSQHDLDIIILLDNVQYSRNVAEIFQVAEAYRVRKIYLTGSSAHPPFGKDLQKASLISERKVEFEKKEQASEVIKKYKAKGYNICAYSFLDNSLNLNDIKFKSDKIMLVFGNETNGLSKEIQMMAHNQFYIPNAHDNSFLNLNIATTITLNTLFNKSRKIL
jgi:TrmH family RNA methyltransferase